jgi:hypothetical protein
MESWTDERLDDFAASLRPLPAEIASLRVEMASIRGDRASMRAELAHLAQRVDSNTEEIRLLRQDVSALQRQLAQIGWGYGFVLLAGVIGAVAF